MQYLLNNEHLLHPIKNIIIGGGAISEKMKNRIGDMGINAYATYGMTETCSHIALARIGRGNEPYKALPGISFSTDDRGCLVADVPHLSIQRVITNMGNMKIRNVERAHLSLYYYPDRISCSCYRPFSKTDTYSDTRHDKAVHKQRGSEDWEESPFLL